jgi:DNA polymerase-3 subunit delta'
VIEPYPWHREAQERFLAQRGNMPHAVLVTGQEGIGKAQLARSIAAAVLCESPRGAFACGQCASCHWYEQGNHPDFREIIPEAAEEEAEGEAADTAKSEKAKSVVIKIEQVRAIADFVSLSTHRAGHRVLLLHPAESMQPAAANALLKTLEEPPPGTLIVLVSGQPARVLPTIRSRCRLLPLRAPAPEEAIAWLGAQGVADPRTALAAAGGAPLLAHDLAQPEEAQLRERVLQELARPSGADPLSFASAIDRPKVERFLYWMQTWVQDLVRVKLSGEARHHRAHGKALAARARAADLEALFALDRELAGARALADHPLNPRLLAEHLLMAYNRATLQASGTP